MPDATTGAASAAAPTAAPAAGVQAMDPVIQALFNNIAANMATDHITRMGRQADMALADQRTITAYVMNQAAGAGVPELTGGLNTASHIPTSQPYVAPNFVNPQGGPPATTPKTA